MPTLTAPPEIELPTIAFFGRSLDEYVRFFELDPAVWRGRAILDVAAGPSSFTAEACRRGIDAVAVDPLYGTPAPVLAARIQADYARMFAQMRAKPALFKLARPTSPNIRAGTTRDFRRASLRPYAASSTDVRTGTHYATIAAAESDRRAAAQRFLTDYEAHVTHNRYIGAALPHLPYFDGAFDLVLCAHLLFTYSRHFNFEWHLAACGELARVSAGEVRLHPLCGPDGRRYPELERLRRELDGQGIRSKVVPVAYEFFLGSNSMLVLNPA